MSGLGAAFGVIIGFSLGLTGGGGSIFAVPLLVYGLSLEPREAIGVSLVAVGATAFVGFLRRWHAHEVDARTGLLFAFCGMLGAPLGALIGGHIPGALLLTLFAALMLIVAVRMWRVAARDPAQTKAVRAETPPREPALNASCKRDPRGRLELTSRCAMVLGLVGIITGVLSGLFGVGGGFVIVPALVFFSAMDIRRAVATSLLVISLVSLAAIVSHVASGESLNGTVAAVFAAGGVGGLLLGTMVAKSLSGPALQRVFAVSIVLVAGFTITKTFIA